MKINLGCGDRYAPDWINVDLPGMPHRKDLAVDLTGPLPWQAGTLESVYCGHVLEHLPLQEARDLLARLLPLMVPRGPIMVVGPDVDRARELLPDGISDEFGATFQSVRCGAGRWAGDEHLWDCTSDQLEMMLHVAGWAKVTPVSLEEAALLWPVADPRPRWQCAVGALATPQEQL